ncbi:hypothetical protein O6H91_Y136700 [Diphasiastrum complanatum]|nr:hypothetical protein O6H91_Y136700 [Diphasiastrum complanatum]
MPNRANGAPSSLLHVQPSMSFVLFQGTCKKAWDTGTTEPTSVLDLDSPSPSSRAASSISGSHDDIATVSSYCLYEESERKTQGSGDGGGYIGRELGQHSRMSTGSWMDGSLFEGEVGASNFEGAAVESWHSRAATGDWRTKELKKSSCTAHEHVHFDTPPLLRTESRNYFGNHEKANFFHFSTAISTCTRNRSEDEPGGGNNLSGGDRSRLATIPGAQGFISASEASCEFSNQVETNGDWRCEETRNGGLDELLIGFQGYSELPLHDHLPGAAQCGMENLDSMICKSLAPTPDQSLMRWLLWENDQVQTIREESLAGVKFHDDLSSRLNVKSHNRTTSMETTGAPIPTSMSDNQKVRGASQSVFPILTSTSSYSALAQAPGIPKFTATFPYNFRVSSTHKNQAVASEILRPQVKTMPYSGISALVSHNEMPSSSSVVCFNSSEGSLAQEKFISQNTFGPDSDQLFYSANPTLTEQHPFEYSDLPFLAASQPPFSFYPHNSCQRFNENMLQHPASGQSELPARYQLAGHNNQFRDAYPSVGIENQFRQYLGKNPDIGATWQMKVHLETAKEKSLLPSKQYDPQVNLSHSLPIGFFSSDRQEHQALQLCSTVQERMEDADDGLALVNQLLQLVEALDTGDPDGARSILARLNQYPLSQTKYIQRLAYYLREVLAARVMDIPQSSCQILSPLGFLQKVTAYNKFCEASPFLSFAHFMANQAILDALEGEEIIHVIDFEINFGGQWASFLQDFALKPGNARRLRITAVGLQHDEMYFAGERLCNFAKEHNILLDFQMVVAKPGSLTSAMLPVRDKEPVAVNFVLGLHKMLGDCPGSIDVILRVVKGLSPRVVTVVEKELDDNSPHLRRRFFEALNYYSYLSDLLGAGNMDNETIMSIEKLLFWPEIMDIVVRKRLVREEQCKGLQRWRQRFLSAGFYNIPLSNLAEMNAECLIRECSAFQGYKILKNEGSILLGWHDKTLLAASAWTC